MDQSLTLPNTHAHSLSPPHASVHDLHLYRNTVQQPSVPVIPQPPQARYAQNDAYFGSSQRIDVDALAAGVQRYIHNPSAYIALPPGMDPATVDFRTFYPYNPSEVKHRKRTTRSQLKILEDTFKRETKPNAALRKTLAAELEMTPRGVQVWFQNRRAKEKALAKKAANASGDKKQSVADVDVDQDLDEDDSPLTDLKPQTDEGSPANEASTPEASPEPAQHSQHAGDSSSTANASASPEEQQPVKRETGPQPSGLGVSRTSWQGPGTTRASVNETNKRASPTSPTTLEFASEVDDNIVNLRRPSLPTHLGNAVPTGLGQGGPPSAFRMRHASGFDPSQRRMSLDRLAAHPYARFAIEANGAVYGDWRSRSHQRLPIGPKVTTPTPQRPELPSTMSAMPNMEGMDTQTQTQAMRPELMHRASIPAQSMHMPRSFEFTGSQPLTPASADNLAAQRMRFPRDGHNYVLPSRQYQPPIPGPLPAPDFSFGTCESTPSSSESENDGSGGAGLHNYAFPRDVSDRDEEVDESSAPYVYHSRFGSMASIADSESSIASGYYSEAGSYDIRPSTSQSLQGHVFDPSGRRQSCNGQFLDMFSHLDVQNGSTTSLSDAPKVDSPGGMQNGNPANNGQAAPAEGTSNFPSPSSTVSGRSKDGRPSLQVTMLPPSQPSELTYALHVKPEHDNRHSQDMSNGRPSLDGSMISHTYSHRSSSSGESLMYPLSASSSTSSLHSRPALTLITSDKFVADGFETVSGTGHYSPVSHPSSALDFPTSAMDMYGHGFANGHGGNGGNGVMMHQQHGAPGMYAGYVSVGGSDDDFTIAKIPQQHEAMGLGLHVAALGDELVQPPGSYGYSFH